MARFQDQVVLVTGATSGIGAEIARQMSDEGAIVVGTGRDPERLEALAGRVAMAVPLDLTDEASVAQAASQVLAGLGRVDVLVNNAGIGLFRPWQETAVPDVARVMDVNLYGAIRLTRALLPSMLERGAGTVANVASVAGKRGYPKHTAYCASKHALVGWSEALRCDLRDSGVRVVVVCPPAVRTPFFENAGYLTFDEDHPGFVPMTAHEAARQTVDAIARGERQRIVSTRAKLLYAMSLVAPGAVDGLRRLKR